MPTGSGWKNFTSASLTADDVNGYLMSQSVMVFDSSVTRSAILVAPTEGMLTYLKDTNLLQYYTGSAYANVGGGGGVTSFTSSSGLSVNTGATGAVSVTNTGVTAFTSSSGLSTNTSATGAVSVTNTGVTSNVAGTGVSVSGATGAVTISIGQSVATSAKPTFAGVDLTAYSTYPAGDNSRFVFGPNSTWGAYLHIGATTDKTANGQAQVISTNGNLHIDSGRNNAMYLNYYSAGRPIEVFGSMTFSASQYIAVNSGVTDANSISCSGWFRTTGDTGLYFQTYGGGWVMTDATWIRGYGDKNIYTGGEIRSGQRFTGNVGRQRGSYGAINIGSNGVTNTWNGIEFEGDAQTFMVQGDFHSGMYANNSQWNWLFYYSTLQVGSDVRYKREITPLALGLNFIEQLQPISFLKLTEASDDDPEATEAGYQYGFSAQNVRASLDAVGETRDVRIHDVGGPNMGLIACTEDAVYDRQYIGITEFIAPMVQAIKELSDKVKALEGAQ